MKPQEIQAFHTTLGTLWNEATKYNHPGSDLHFGIELSFLNERAVFRVYATWIQDEKFMRCEGRIFHLQDNPEWACLAHYVREVGEMVRRKQRKQIKQSKDGK